MSSLLPPLGRSFRVALRGAGYCVRSERNLRIHLCAGAGALLLSLFYDFGPTQYALLALLICVVLAAEMLNTAVERAVDLFSPGYHHLAGLVKDIAAGAVLVCAAGAVAVGLLLFLEGRGLRRLLHFAAGCWPVFLAGVLAYIFLAACFVFWPEVRAKRGGGRGK